MIHSGQDVVIIGAARSGTNMLRDALTNLARVATWPCDEINYVWRHGNTRYPNDELLPEFATGAVTQYIRSTFTALRRKTGASTIVEKTCANSLRVAFVNEVLPAATFVYITRDGIDAATSATARWTAPLDLGYIAKKARFIPPTDLPYYAARYLGARAHRFTSRERRLSTWGPRPEGMTDWLREYDLLTVCALQWKACVDASDRDLADLPKGRVVNVRYEDLVSVPGREFRRLCHELRIDAAETDIQRAIAGIDDRSVGRGRNGLEPDVLERLQFAVGDTMERHGYF